MVAGEPCGRGSQRLWNIVDARDVGEAQARIIQCQTCGTGDRYQMMTATDERSELDAAQLQAHLQKLVPDYEIGGPPDGCAEIIEKNGRPHAPRARCDKARRDLGLQTHPIGESLYETVRSMIDLGLVTPALKAAH